MQSKNQWKEIEARKFSIGNKACIFNNKIIHYGNKLKRKVIAFSSYYFFRSKFISFLNIMLSSNSSLDTKDS